MTFVPLDYLPYDFANLRHIGPSKSEIRDMLAVVGAESLDDLIEPGRDRRIDITESFLPRPGADRRQILVEIAAASGGAEQPGDLHPAFSKQYCATSACVANQTSGGVSVYESTQSAAVAELSTRNGGGAMYVLLRRR